MGCFLPWCFLAPLPDIDTGIKSWGACTRGGICLASYVDSGWEKDPRMRDLSNCALGRTTNNVLCRLLCSTSALTVQVDGSGVKVAMDRSFTFPVLF